MQMYLLELLDLCKCTCLSYYILSLSLSHTNDLKVFYYYKRKVNGYPKGISLKESTSSKESTVFVFVFAFAMLIPPSLENIYSCDIRDVRLNK